jgi:hypothetical protein
MPWLCKDQHPFNMTLNAIKYQNQWCPTCAGNSKRTIEDCHKIAASHNGKCNSTTYENNKSPIEWQCRFNHTWKASLDVVSNQGSWCPTCYGNAPKTINDCHELVRRKNGKCKEVEYINNATIMSWECEIGHDFGARFNAIQTGDWCPYCSNGVSKPQIEVYEDLVSSFPDLEIILNDKIAIHPKHLDIFIPELKIGIEYDGEFFHYSNWAIEKGAKKRMSQKDKICKQANIILIRIREGDYINDPINELRHIAKIIKKQLK